MTPENSIPPAAPRSAAAVPPQAYAAARTRAAIFDRSPEGRLRITGADRAGWLQGLVTNDVVSLRPGEGCYAAYLTPQGRMISDMRILVRPDHVLVDLPASTVAAVQERFEMFVITEDVSIENVSRSLGRFAVHGPAAAELLVRALAPFVAGEMLEERLGGLEEHASLQVSCEGTGTNAAASGGCELIVAGARELGETGFDLYFPAVAGVWLRAVLRDAGAVEGEASVWDVLRLEAGTPVFGRDMDENTIPLEAGIEDRAISFTKGCYVGQEIIVRVVHRGHGRVARRLVRLAPADSEPAATPTPSAGDVVTSSDGEREIGRITSAARSPALGHVIALGYVQRDFAEPGTAVIVRRSDARLRYRVQLPMSGPE
jgi:folate-binding protein YgfZ